jgi:hypothetical protein
MTKEEIIAQVDQSFVNLQRPRMFIRGTCSCDECMEHEETMQSFALPHLPLDKLGYPSWDPICFASDDAFAYLMPGLIRLVLNHTENYVSQFLFHLDSPDRIAVLSKGQRRTLLHALDYMFMNETNALDNNMVIDDFIRVREKLEQTA